MDVAALLARIASADSAELTELFVQLQALPATELIPHLYSIKNTAMALPAIESIHFYAQLLPVSAHHADLARFVLSHTPEVHEVFRHLSSVIPELLSSAEAQNSNIDMTNFIMELSQYIGGMAVSLSYCQSVVQIFASNPSIPVCSSLCELALPSILQISGSSLTESKSIQNRIQSNSAIAADSHSALQQQLIAIYQTSFENLTALVQCIENLWTQSSEQWLEDATIQTIALLRSLGVLQSSPIPDPKLLNQVWKCLISLYSKLRSRLPAGEIILAEQSLVSQMTSLTDTLCREHNSESFPRTLKYLRFFAVNLQKLPSSAEFSTTTLIDFVFRLQKFRSELGSQGELMGEIQAQFLSVITVILKNHALQFPQTVPSIHQYLDRLIKSKPIPDSIFTNCTVLGALPFSSDACKLLLSSFPDTAGQDSKVSGALMNCFDECITNFAVSESAELLSALVTHALSSNVTTCFLACRAFSVLVSLSSVSSILLMFEVLFRLFSLLLQSKTPAFSLAAKAIGFMLRILMQKRDSQDNLLNALCQRSAIDACSTVSVLCYLVHRRNQISMWDQLSNHLKQRIVSILVDLGNDSNSDALTQRSLMFAIRQISSSFQPNNSIWTNVIRTLNNTRSQLVFDECLRTLGLVCCQLPPPHIESVLSAIQSCANSQASLPAIAEFLAALGKLPNSPAHSKSNSLFKSIFNQLFNAKFLDQQLDKLCIAFTSCAKSYHSPVDLIPLNVRSAVLPRIQELVNQNFDSIDYDSVFLNRFCELETIPLVGKLNETQIKRDVLQLWFSSDKSNKTNTMAEFLGFSHPAGDV